MPIMRLFMVMLIAGVCCLNAAPLESGYTLAPSASASSAEKAAAYQKARTQVLTVAEKYEKTPYRYGGTDRKGLDCSGFVYLTFSEALGIAVPRNASGLYSWVEKISIERASPGDLVFFCTTGNGRISHVGIFLGNGRFIHAASEGPSTGVIYSRLDERYWSRTYAGAGRALPASNMGGSTSTRTEETKADPKVDTKADTRIGDAKEDKRSITTASDHTSNKLMGFALAPTWNSYYTGDTIFRGAAGQFRLGAQTRLFGKSMIFGMELRPEWDGALGVFRVPLTFSWGLDDRLRFFAGPAISFGDASLTSSHERRQYTGGTSWFGAAGVTIAPVTLYIAGNELMPYGELAWQSYRSDNANSNFGSDFAAGFRFSTGLRYTWRTK